MEKHGKEDGLRSLDKRMTLPIKANKARQSVGKEKEQVGQISYWLEVEQK